VSLFSSHLVPPLFLPSVVSDKLPHYLEASPFLPLLPCILVSTVRILPFAHLLRYLFIRCHLPSFMIAVVMQALESHQYKQPILSCPSSSHSIFSSSSYRLLFVILVAIVTNGDHQIINMPHLPLQLHPHSSLLSPGEHPPRSFFQEPRPPSQPSRLPA
jgi:hypothetical protein